jgi:hypothetical protein
LPLCRSPRGGTSQYLSAGTGSAAGESVNSTVGVSSGAAAGAAGTERGELATRPKTPIANKTRQREAIRIELTSFVRNLFGFQRAVFGP